MKVLQISANWGHGGPGGVVKDIHNYLCENGHEAVVAYGRYDVPADIKSIKIGNRVSVYLHVLLSRLFDISGFGSSWATQKFIKEIDRVKPDVVHIHNLLGYYINVEILFNYLKKANIPTVWTLHDCWEFTGHCINFERINCKKWKEGCGNCSLRGNYPEAWLKDNSKSNFIKKKQCFTGVSKMLLVTPSQWLKNLVQESYLKDYECEVINNGIDLQVFKPTASDIRSEYGLQDKKILLFVASVWNDMKGEQIVYQLADELDDSFAMVMIGRKSSENIPDRIINIPRTQNVDELVKWYSAADVFVNPTLGDNFPTVNIEALACGTPVVTSNTGGSPEVAGNEYGCVVYSKEIEEFIDKINQCIKRGLTTEECREAATKYDRDACFRKYVAIYTKAKEMEE